MTRVADVYSEKKNQLNDAYLKNKQDKEADLLRVNAELAQKKTELNALGMFKFSEKKNKKTEIESLEKVVGKLKKEISALEEEYQATVAQLEQEKIKDTNEAKREYLNRHSRPIRPAYPVRLLYSKSINPTDVAKAAMNQEILEYLEEHGMQSVEAIIKHVDIVAGMSERYVLNLMQFMIQKGLLVERKENRTTYYLPNPDMTKYLEQDSKPLSGQPKKMTAKQIVNQRLIEAVVKYLKDKEPMTIDEIQKNCFVFDGVGMQKVQEVLGLAEDEDLIESFDRGKKTYYRVIR